MFESVTRVAVHVRSAADRWVRLFKGPACEIQQHLVVRGVAGNNADVLAFFLFCVSSQRTPRQCRREGADSTHADTYTRKTPVGRVHTRERVDVHAVGPSQLTPCHCAGDLFIFFRSGGGTGGQHVDKSCMQMSWARNRR